VRVLVLTHRLPYPPNRGDRIRSYHLVKFLARHADVHVLSLVHSDEEEAQARDMRGMVASIETARVPRLTNLARAVLALPGPAPLTHVLLDGPALTPALQRLVASHPPHVVLAYCSGMARLAMAPPLDRIPFVLDMVDVDSVKWDALGRSGTVPMRLVYRREARRLRAFELASTRRAATTVVVNEREKEAMQAVNPAARVEVISNGIDVETFRRRGLPAASTNVVFCGVFNYEPNERAAVWLAREVWPLVRAQRPDATLSLVGLDPSRQVRALAADRSILVTGAVEDVRPYLWGAAASAAPLLIARGLQNKVLEAIAAGLPCVVTPPVAEGLPQDVLAACRVASDPQPFADRIVELLDLPPEHRATLAAAARIERFGWDDRLRPMLDALRSASAHGIHPRY
jgi:polysaccharide biosynthesis protein PslH